MKRITILLILLWVQGSSAQPFANLNFELARTNITLSVPPDVGVGYGPANDLLPYWQVSSSKNGPVNLIGLDAMPLGLGEGIASVYENSKFSLFSSVLGPIDAAGMFSFGMRHGVEHNSTNLIALSVSQRGEIPPGVQSMNFLCYGTPELKIDDMPVALIGTAPGYYLPDENFSRLAADVSAYAGKTVQIQFSTGLEGSFIMDDIRFSPKPIPEPRAVDLLTLGGLLMGLWRVVRRRASSPSCKTPLLTRRHPPSDRRAALVRCQCTLDSGSPCAP